MTSASKPPLAAPSAEQRWQAALHFDRASQLVATGSHLPGIRLLIECCRLDPANLLEECSAAASRAKIDEALDRLGDDVVLAHAKDRDGRGAVQPPGQGVVDFRHFIAGLDRVGFGGAIVMHGFAEADVDAATAHLRPLVEA